MCINPAGSGLNIHFRNLIILCFLQRLVGMCANESLQRYSGFVNKKYGYQGRCWISKQYKDVWCVWPLYDWSVNDVWVANYTFHYDYNKLYDMYYKAGLKPDQMRIAFFSMITLRIAWICTRWLIRPSEQSWWSAVARFVATEFLNIPWIKSPGLFFWEKFRMIRTIQKHQGYSQLEANVPLYFEKWPYLPVYGVWPVQAGTKEIWFDQTKVRRIFQWAVRVIKVRCIR